MCVCVCVWCSCRVPPAGWGWGILQHRDVVKLSSLQGTTNVSKVPACYLRLAEKPWGTVPQQGGGKSSAFIQGTLMPHRYISWAQTSCLGFPLESSFCAFSPLALLLSTTPLSPQRMLLFCKSTVAATPVPKVRHTLPLISLLPSHPIKGGGTWANGAHH